MLKNTLSLHPSVSTTTELIYCTSPPTPTRPFSLSSTLSSPLSNHQIPSSNTTMNNIHTNNNNNPYLHFHNNTINNTSIPSSNSSSTSSTSTTSSTTIFSSNRFSFNLTNLFTTFFTLFLFSCYFFSVTYHWLNLYPNSVGFPLGLKFLFLNQEPENVFSLIDQMQQFGRDHQKSLDFIHVFVTIPLFTCFVLGLWFDSFLSSNSNHYSNHHNSYLMKIGVCFMIGLQLLLSWMEKIMIMVLLEKHPFDVRIIGKNPLMRAVKDVEILNLTSKASFILGFLLVLGGFLSIHYKNNQQQQYSDSSSLFNHSLAYEIGAGTIGATVAGATTYVGVPLVVSSLGFGSGGVVAGTTAAGMMSAAGNVAAGSLVAGLQSVGATGAVALGTTVLPVTLVVGAGVAVGYHYWNKKGDNTSSSTTIDENKTNEENDKFGGSTNEENDNSNNGNSSKPWWKVW
ncbi:predicted protein [Naegleria gruberi]|uniref:Predicted protein n=1 Tax=Naegleria gruberi TaxID=5762 RepID=D2V8H0_NAEGR|nr:uncharacterized protein NAEGRDRAFT_78995 [Naegleria gruberi]EFC46682.1 predicted protein [Naegleria gruberi]|eukprot:XP_002679426.1 predicted protein [Naegleria gruberi strain NEG-M]